MREKEKIVNYSTLKKYFSEKTSVEDAAKIHEWLGRAENGFYCEKCLHMLWNEPELDNLDKDAELDGLLDKIHHLIHLKYGKPKKVRRLTPNPKRQISFKRVIRTLGRVAVIILLPVMAYIGWEIYSQKMWVKDQTEIVYNEIICPLGARSRFELPDGTTGSLNNGSRLKYPIKFFGKTREVELIGEAYFDVYHDRSRPFIINTAGLDVKVLGTSLNIYSYPGEEYQEFTLESGTIEIFKRENDQELTVTTLNPGQHMVYSYKEEREIEKVSSDKTVFLSDSKELDGFIKMEKTRRPVTFELEEGKIDISIQETEHFTAWKDGRLVLRNDPMPMLLKRIERWYNVNFNVLDESILEYSYWATFEEENLDQVLKLLSLTGPIRFEKRHREVMDDGRFKVQEIDVLLKR